MAAHIGIDDSGIDRGARTAMSKLEGLQKKIRQSGLGMIKIGLVIAAPLALATKTFAGFDDAMRATQAVTQSTKQEFKELTDQAKFLGRTTSYTARQVAEADLVLGRAGQNVKESIGPILNLARATGTDLAEAAGYASATLNAFNLEANQMGRVTDVLVTGANNAAQTLGDLGASLVYSAKVAEQFGLSLEQTTKYISAMADVGIKGSMAGTSLRMAMLQLTKGDIQEKIKTGLDIDVVSAATGEMKDLLIILNEMTDSIENLGMGPAKKMEIFTETFGARAMAGMLALSSKNFDELNAAMANAAGTAAKTAEDMDAGIGGALRILWSAVEGTTIAIGESLAPALIVISKIFTDVLGVVTAFLEENKWLVQAIGLVAVGLLAYGSALVAASVAIPVLTFAVSGLTAAFGLLSSVIGFALSPLGILVGVLALVAYWTGAFSHEVAKLNEVDIRNIDNIKKQNSINKIRLERLEQLSNKQNKNNEEMEEAQLLIQALGYQYNDFNVTLDKTTGKVNGLTEAYKKVNEEMKAREEYAIKNDLDKLRQNAEEITKTIEGLGGALGDIDVDKSPFNFLSFSALGLVEDLRKVDKEIAELEKKQSAFLKPKEDTTIKERLATEAAALAVSAEQTIKWNERIADIKLDGIKDETARAAAEIELRYERERKLAENNADIIALINEAAGLEMTQLAIKAADEVADEAEKAAKKAAKVKIELAEAEAREIQTLDQRIAMIKVKGIEDEHKRRVAEIKARYKYEIEQAKGNAKIISKLEEARQLELEQEEKDKESKSINKASQLADVIIKGEAGHYAAVVGQTLDPAKQTAKNTKKMVQILEREAAIKKWEEDRQRQHILNLGL